MTINNYNLHKAQVWVILQFFWFSCWQCGWFLEGNWFLNLVASTLMLGNHLDMRTYFGGGTIIVLLRHCKLWSCWRTSPNPTQTAMVPDPLLHQQLCGSLVWPDTTKPQALLNSVGYILWLCKLINVCGSVFECTTFSDLLFCMDACAVGGTEGHKHHQICPIRTWGSQCYPIKHRV